MKAPLFICFLLSSVLVFPFALAARELHIVEHNGASNNFPVTYGIGGQNRGKRTCHREGMTGTAKRRSKKPSREAYEKRRGRGRKL
ncbi:Uncharacterized protein TCM_019588 [Theobroma cacao]|uniref:Secreted protein n=1 Tax=Theobroma cacao TaxID=3641 RepID=A0A061EH19_THECC|nr:Uncharacterized protein TCM_019588 [Theobroma cacao]